MLVKTIFLLIGLMATDVLALPLKRQSTAKLGGVNLAVSDLMPIRRFGLIRQGCEFGMTTDGGSGTYYCPGTDQVTHFTSKGANL